MNIPYLEIEKQWSANDVQILCIKKDWYMYGTDEEYENMLNMVRNYYPSDLQIFFVAEDIFEHSNKEYWIKNAGMTKEEAIESIMFELVNNIVHTFYKIW